MSLRPPSEPAPQAPPIPAWLAIGTMLVMLIASQLVGVTARSIALALVKAVTGGPVAPEHPAATLAGMAAGAGLLTAVALGMPLMFNRSPVEAYALRRAPLPVFVAAAVGTVSLGPLADRLMVWMAEHFPGATLGALSLLHDLAQGHAFWLLWPFFALLPGLSEELFFRGLVQRSFVRPWLSIGISALAFALFHLDPHHIVGVFPLGVFLAWVGFRYGTLVTIVAHVANNTIALATIQISALDVGYGSDVPMPASWVFVGLTLAGAATLALARYPELRGPAPA